MTAEIKHISVCVCTYKRPHLLKRLLRELGGQHTGGLFTYSIVIVDNDCLQSARRVVSDFAATTKIPTSYFVEPQQNIALARNRSLENTSGDFIAFLDDDEEPPTDWLIRLVEAIESYRADGVLGPVLPHFATPPPDWIVRGKFFERPPLPTGTWLQWGQTRMGNVLLRRRILEDPQNRFLPEYGGGGEDADLFRRLTAKGMRFVWCAEAAVREIIPPERCRRTYLLRRALLRGRAPYNQGWPVVKSLVAAPTYALALPLLFLFNHRAFMWCLIKECDHLGRILAFLGLDVVKEKYVSG